MENKVIPGGRQYATAGNLNARIYLNARFSANKYPWPVWLFDRLEKREGLKILELGCGTGLFWQANSERIPRSWDLVLSDYSEGMALEAAKNLSGLPVKPALLVIDAVDITLPDKAFDAVIANNMLYHIQDRARALGEIRRVLKNDGVFYAATGGEKSLQELKRLLVDFKNEPGFDPTLGEVVNAFSLENGREQLQAFFGDIQLVKYENALEITEADPIVDYFLSFQDMKSGHSLLEERETAPFRQYLQGLLEKSGKITVTKDSGMFICKNPKAG